MEHWNFPGLHEPEASAEATYYSYAIHRTVQICLAPPKDIQVQVNQGITRTRLWNAEKLAAVLQVELEPMLSPMIDDLELEMVVARSSDTRFSWKPEKIGAVMEEVEVEDFLSG